MTEELPKPDPRRHLLALNRHALLAMALTVFSVASLLTAIVAAGFPCHGRHASLLVLLLSATGGLLVAFIALAWRVDEWRRQWQTVLWVLLMFAAILIPHALLNLIAFVASGGACAK